MLSEDRHQIHTATKWPKGITPPPIPDPTSQDSVVEQLSFQVPLAQPRGSAQDTQTVPQSDFPPAASLSQTTSGPITSPGIVNIFPDTISTEPESEHLADKETGLMLAAPTGMTEPLRKRVIIQGTGKKSVGTLLAPQPKGRRLRMHAAVIAMAMFVLLVTLIAVLPVNNGRAIGLSLFDPPLKTINSKSNNTTALIGAQIATATAVTQDGYDAGGNHHYAGVVSAPVAAPANAPSSAGSSNPSDAGSLSRFQYGQCTYWANFRYHQITGHFVPWLGNAYQWAYAASGYGWVVSSMPNPNGHSIIVLGPGVEGAGSYGHVAIVESINANGSLTTSNWNWAGAYATTTYVTLHSGPGVTFVWYPGAA